MKCVHLESSDVGDHVGQQGVAGNVEKHTQTDITRALVQLTWQLTVWYVKLTQRMARGQRHQREIWQSQLSIQLIHHHAEMFKLWHCRAVFILLTKTIKKYTLKYILTLFNMLLKIVFSIWNTAAIKYYMKNFI